MPDIPNFNLQNNFPISTVVNAAQRKAELDNQTTLAQSKLINDSLGVIGQVGKSLFDQRVRVAQALASAHLYAQTPEGKQALGTNQVAQTAQGPVTQNQTASYDPNSGSVTPLQSPVDVRTIATAMYGMDPKDVFQNQIQNRLASTQQGELALKQQTEPQKISIEGQKALAEVQNAQVMRQIQAMLAAATVKNQAQERTQAAQNADFEANKEVSKHFILHPIDAYKASQAMTATGQGNGTAQPQSGWKYIGPVKK